MQHENVVGLLDCKVNVLYISDNIFGLYFPILCINVTSITTFRISTLLGYLFLAELNVVRLMAISPIVHHVLLGVRVRLRSADAKVKNAYRRVSD